MQTRRIAVEERRKTLDERNLLAAENECIRAEQAREKNERSERALGKLSQGRMFCWNIACLAAACGNPVIKVGR